MIIGILLVGLLLLFLAYVSKRRFGLLGLALIAGVIVSSNWATYVTSMLQVQGVSLSFPPLSIVVAGSLIVFPALLLLLVGPIYHKRWQRLASSTLFALFAISFIASMIYHEAPALASEDVFVLIAGAQPFILAITVILALGDIIANHFPKKKK